MDIKLYKARARGTYLAEAGPSFKSVPVVVNTYFLNESGVKYACRVLTASATGEITVERPDGSSDTLTVFEGWNPVGCLRVTADAEAVCLEAHL